MEFTRKRKLELLKKSVHCEFDRTKYTSTVVRNNTNCYAYALGSTLSFIELYRIGAICGKKNTDEEYRTAEEVLTLLKEDLDVLDLKIEKSFDGDKLEQNQYQIALYIAVYADKRIHDFHFLRFDTCGWSEKRRYQLPVFSSTCRQEDSFPNVFLGVFKITK